MSWMSHSWCEISFFKEMTEYWRQRKYRHLHLSRHLHASEDLSKRVTTPSGLTFAQRIKAKL
ncbi:hypothetical protein SAMN04488244_1511 [Vibrio hangzhouensis]|uniref:Uncharacterized protein n=1 Tax=Vibrio hangzhouensis TaxID=462991 RepID=A0A1H6CPI6_9VIBR|nr:hypothetical protein SAMN04488244_1511 [Vibrio hangzhouensis]